MGIEHHRPTIIDPGLYQEEAKGSSQNNPIGHDDANTNEFHDEIFDRESESTNEDG